MKLAYFPHLQISIPNDARGVPPNRVLYLHEIHALSAVLDAYAKNERKFVRSAGVRLWIMQVVIPEEYRLQEISVNLSTSRFPVYYSRGWCKVKQVIEAKNSEDWIAASVQRKMQKSSFKGYKVSE